MRLVLALACWGALAAAHANVVVAGTRVVYNGGDREVTIKLSNPGDTPALVQAWVDKGNSKSTPDTADAPFLIMPPIFRIEPGKSQTLRMVYTGDGPSPDKETVYWLNILDVPPLPQGDEAGRNYLQIAFRSRLKIFFRPVGLAGNPDDAAEQVRWQLVPQAAGKGYALRGANASAFSVSFNMTMLQASGHEFRSDGGMIPAGGTQDFNLKDMRQLPAGPVTVQYETINDYGAPVVHSVVLTP
ncbi:fimbrial biogenesis chaperone [Chromobacterium sphagni]|nr:molecular chaperone [Chromobacterium sphagni]